MKHPPPPDKNKRVKGSEMIEYMRTLKRKARDEDGQISPPPLSKSEEKSQPEIGLNSTKSQAHFTSNSSGNRQPIQKSIINYFSTKSKPDVLESSTKLRPSKHELESEQNLFKPALKTSGHSYDEIQVELSLDKPVKSQLKRVVLKQNFGKKKLSRK